MPHPSAPNAYPSGPRDFPSSPDDLVIVDVADGSRTGAPVDVISRILSDPVGGGAYTGNTTGEVPGGVTLAVDRDVQGARGANPPDQAVQDAGTVDKPLSHRTGATVDSGGTAIFVVDLPLWPTTPSTGLTPSPDLLPGFTLNSEGAATGTPLGTISFTWLDTPVTSRTGSTVDRFGTGIFIVDPNAPGSRTGTPDPETLFYDRKPGDVVGGSRSGNTLGTWSAEIVDLAGTARTGTPTGETLRVDQAVLDVTPGSLTGSPFDGAGYDRLDTGPRTSTTGLPNDGARPVWKIWPDVATGNYTGNSFQIYSIDYHDRQGEGSRVGWTVGDYVSADFPIPDPRLVTIFTYNYPGATTFTAFYPGLSQPFGSLIPATPDRAGVPADLRYRLYLAITTSGRIAYELPIESVSWGSVLNSIGNCSATVVVQNVYDALNDQDERDPRNLFRQFLATGAYRYSMVLTYGNAVVWAGPYTPTSVPGDTTIQIGGSDFGALLQRRLLVGPRPPGETSDVHLGPCSKAELVRRLVIYGASDGDHSLPWTMFDRPPDAGDHTRTYLGYDLQSVWQALSTLSQEADGPDFRFDPSLEQRSNGNYVSWNLVVGRPLLAQPHEWGWDAPTNATVMWQTNVSNFATTYYGTGSGQDRSKLIAVSSNHKLIDAGFPLLELTDSLHSNIIVQDNLQALTDADLATYSTPVVRWTIQVQASTAPQLGSYRVGDTIQVRVQRHPVIPDGVYQRRITSMSGTATDQVQITSSDAYAVTSTTSTGVQIVSSG